MDRNHHPLTHRPNRLSAHKQGQMEIMGLAIIVVLIMLGVLFAIRFVLLAPEEDVAGEFKESELVAKAVPVMLQTHTDCHGATMAALLEDCATTASFRCPSGSSCVHAKRLFAQYFKDTFDAWNREYEFKVSGNRRVEDLALSRGACNAAASRASEYAQTPVPTAAGIITVSFRLCR